MLLLIAVGVGLIGWTWQFSPHRWRLAPRVTDEIGLMVGDLRVKHEETLLAYFDESGVDYRVVLVAGTGNESIEQYAVRRARDLEVGRKTGGRGVLIVYDSLRRELRFEVGPQLQGVLPDGFVGFVGREHAKALFEGGDPELGLRIAVRILHYRIRDAQLGGEYDPSFAEYVQDARRLASGGGATDAFRSPGSATRPAEYGRARPSDSMRFSPQPTVAAAQARYLEWLALDRHVARVPLFTTESQNYLAGLPLTRAFKAAVLTMEYGKAYAVDQRGDLALLYFTGTPLASPHFFRRTEAGWQLDIKAELLNSTETMGFLYSWVLLESSDEFHRAFVDRWMPLRVPGHGTFFRIAGGDNRGLVTRANPDTAALALDRRLVRDGAFEGVTVFEAASRVRAVEGRPSIVVLYKVDAAEQRQEFDGLVRLAEFCKEHGVELLAFDASEGNIDLEQFFISKGAGFPPVHIYQWRPMLLDSTFAALGIQIGSMWAAPLVAVRDRNGQVVAQGQGITDWSAVIQRARETLDR